MKLSNNAIKFLMAQYRAIYKNAYFKGIASAVVLTAGMAAGAAQAATGDTTPVQKEQLQSGAFATNIAKPNKSFVTYTDGKAAWTAEAQGKVEWKADLHSDAIFNSAASSITSKKEATTLSGEGSLTIKHAAKADEFKFASAADATLTVDIGTIDVQKGTLSAVASGAVATTVKADTIKVGSEGVITASGSSATVASTIGDTKSVYELAEGATINLGASGAMLGNISDASGAAINFTGEGAVLQAYGSNVNANISASSKTGVITLAADDKNTQANEGLLSLTAGKIAIDSNSAAAGITLTSGTLELAPSVAVEVKNAGNNAAKLTIGSGSKTLTTVKLSKAQFDKFLQAANGTVVVGANGAISFSDEEQVDISSLKVSGGAIDQGIQMSGSGSIYAADLLVSKAITKDGNNTATDANTKLAIKAGKLTLGSDTYKGKVTLGFSGATAEEVTFKSDGAFALADKVNLSTAKTTPTAITGNVLVSGGALTVEQGAYSAADGIDVSGGTVAVTAAAGKTAFLTVTGNFKAQAADNSEITVSGSGATLDLTGATVTGVGETDKTIAIGVTGGTLKLKGVDVTQLMSTSNSGGLFTVSGSGVVDVDASAEELVLDATKVSGTGLDAKGFNISGGKLAVKGSLVLSGASASIDDGTIQADSLTFKNNTVSVAAGNYIALSSLGAVKADGTTPTALGLSGAAVTLGSKDAPDAEGTLTSDITVGSGTAATLNVTGGVWGDQSTNMTVDVTGSKLQVGGFYAKATDEAAGKPPVAATLKLDTLTGTAGTVTVAEGSSLVLKTLSNAGSTITIGEGASATTNKLTTTGGKLNISGTMSVKGDSTDATNKGVSLVKDNKTVVVTDKGFLEFGATAVGSMLNADGTDLGTSLNGFTAGSIDLQTGGTVKFGFDSGVTLDSTDLKKLRGVFGVADGALTAGVLDLGNATITGVTGEGGVVSEDGTVKWTDIKGFADVNSDVVNKDLADVIVTNISEDVRGNFGSLQQASGSTDEQIGITTSSSLSGADKNNGLFASDSTGKKVVGLNVKNGTLTLNDSGKVGKVTLAKGAVLKLNAGQAGAITVQGDVAGNSAELLVNTGTANVTGAANIGFLDSVKGSTLNAASLNASSATDENTINGNLNVTGDASFAGALKLSGTASVGTFTAKSTLDTAKGSALKVTTGAFTAEKAVDALGTIEVTGSGSVATFKAEAELAADGNKFVDVNFDMDAAILGNTEAAGKV
ncbi:hypothetical protein, partial [Anaerobiospirillum sp. NML120449]|uniref:beta strand repeat-containing protein n=1 Tax=Anaerobiospirillum sp. NML120449 TaxID=2932817 RepID=UPI001FF4017F